MTLLGTSHNGTAMPETLTKGIPETFQKPMNSLWSGGHAEKAMYSSDQPFLP